MNQIVAIGYTEEQAQERIDAFLAQSTKHLLVDIRERPYSRWRPAFNQGALRTHYGEQYRHIQALGNTNFSDPTKGIVIRNPDKGIFEVRMLLDAGYSLMLMCACKHYERCHRKVVVELIREQVTLTIELAK